MMIKGTKYIGIHLEYCFTQDEIIELDSDDDFITAPKKKCNSSSPPSSSTPPLFSPATLQVPIRFVMFCEHVFHL